MKGVFRMDRRGKKVTCISCGEKVDSELVTRTKDGYLCEGCYDLLGEDLDYDEGGHEDEELDFSEEEEEEDSEYFDDEEEPDDYEDEEY